MSIIDGITVITSGHSLDSRDGISLLQTVSGPESKIAFSELVSFSGTDELNTREHDKADVIIEIIPQMIIVESKAHIQPSG